MKDKIRQMHNCIRTYFKVQFKTTSRKRKREKKNWKRREKKKKKKNKNKKRRTEAEEKVWGAKLHKQKKYIGPKLIF